MRNGCLIDITETRQAILNPENLKFGDEETRRNRKLFQRLQEYYSWFRAKMLDKPRHSSAFYCPYQRKSLMREFDINEGHRKFIKDCIAEKRLKSEAD